MSGEESGAVYESATRVYRQALDDDAVLERAKLLLLDFASVVLATHRPEHDRSLAAARRGSAPHALAFELSVRDHYHDYDDIYDHGRVHIGPVTWPALFAMPDLGGRELLAAYAGAATVLGVLGEAAQPWSNPRARSWFLTQTLGGLAAAVACSLAAGADASVMDDALGLAFMQACGTKEPAAGTGSASRRIYPAFGAQSGVLAYELAAAGFDGPPAWASGTAGLGRVYLDDAEFGERLVSALAAASPELVLDIACKPWPCCRSTHRYLNGLRGLFDGFAPAGGFGGTAPEVGLTALPGDVWLLEPAAARTRPATVPDAKYSIPFVLGMALTRGVRLAAWDGSALTDPAVTEVAAALSAGRELADVAEVSHAATRVTCAQPSASTWDIEDAVAKYHECADYAGTLSARHRDQLLTDALRLDQLDSVHGSALGAVLLRG